MHTFRASKSSSQSFSPAMDTGAVSVDLDLEEQAPGVSAVGTLLKPPTELEPAPEEVKGNEPMLEGAFM